MKGIKIFSGAEEFILIQDGDNMHNIVEKVDKFQSAVSLRMKQFNEAGLINITKDGRKKIVTLTHRGKIIQDCLKEIKKLLSNDNNKEIQ